MMKKLSGAQAFFLCFVIDLVTLCLSFLAYISSVKGLWKRQHILPTNSYDVEVLYVLFELQSEPVH